jgi:hypothetical protein
MLTDCPPSLAMNLKIEAYCDASFTQPHQDGTLLNGTAGECGFGANVVVLGNLGLVKSTTKIQTGSRIAITAQVAEMMTWFVTLSYIRNTWASQDFNQLWPDTLVSIDMFTDNMHVVNTLTREVTQCPWVAPIMALTIIEIAALRAKGIQVNLFQMSRSALPMLLPHQYASEARRTIIATGSTNTSPPCLTMGETGFLPSNLFRILRVARIIFDKMWTKATRNKGTPGIYWYWHPTNAPDVSNDYYRVNYDPVGLLVTGQGTTFENYRNNIVRLMRRIAAEDGTEDPILYIPQMFPTVIWQR